MLSRNYIQRPEGLRCHLDWDGFAPGRLKYTLGEVELIYNGKIYHKTTWTRVPKGQGLIVTRNLFLAFPCFCSMDFLIDKIWNNPDKEPDWVNSQITGLIWKISNSLERVGLEIVSKRSVGWRLRFIKDWEAL